MELLPQNTKTWHKLPKEDQLSLGNVNEFFCGLHFLVGLADQVEAVLNLGKMLCLRVKILDPWLMEAIAIVNLEHSVSSEWFVKLFHTEVAKNREE